MTQVRKHKEQAEWAEKKYAELERWDASPVQHFDFPTTVFAMQLLLAVHAKGLAAVCNQDHLNRGFAPKHTQELAQKLLWSAHSHCGSATHTQSSVL